MSRRVLSGSIDRILGGSSKKIAHLKYGEAFGIFDKFAQEECQLDLTAATAILPSIHASKKIFKDSSKPSRTLILPDARESVVNFVRRTVTPDCEEENIVFGSSVFVFTTQLVYDILKLHQATDSLILLTPSFGFYYKNYVGDVRCSLLKTEKDKHWRIDPDKLRYSFNDGGKLLIVSTPSNPMGHLMTKDEIAEVVQVFQENPDKYLLVDEILRDIVFLKNKDGSPFVAPSLSAEMCKAGLSKQIIVTNGLSKRAGNEGARASFAYSDGHIAQEFSKLFERAYPDGFPVASQEALISSLEDNADNQKYLRDCAEQSLERIEIIKSLIDKLNTSLNKHFKTKEVSYTKPYLENPEAGICYLLDFSGLATKILENGSALDSGLKIAELLFDESRIAISPGETYFIDEPVLRLPIATSAEDLEKTFDAMEKMFVSKLRNPPSTVITPSSKSLLFPALEGQKSY